MRAGFAPAALPARAPHLSSLRHTGVPRGSHPGCPSCGPAAPPGRAPPCAPRHARPGSLSPESPPRPGTSAGCLFALRGRRPLGPRPPCPERVDAAAWRALFGIVCAHLSAPGGPRASGQSAPRAGAHLADASSRLPARGPRRAGQGLRKGRAAGSWGGPFPGSPAPERRAEGRGPQVRGQGLGGCGYRREPRIKPELLGAVAQSRSPLTWRPQKGLVFFGRRAQGPPPFYRAFAGVTAAALRFSREAECPQQSLCKQRPRGVHCPTGLDL